MPSSPNPKAQVHKKSAGCFRWLGVFCCLLPLLAMPAAHAESIRSTRLDGKILNNGQLSISTRFVTELPEQLEDALKQGVSLDFALTYQLERPTLASYRFKLSHLVSDNNTVNYRLSYHPLTSRYRVTVGTYSSEYSSLSTALKAVGAIANWSVLEAGTLSDTPQYEVKVNVRLSLSITKLPKPFQINALTSRNWALDSGWRDLNIRR